MKSKMKSSKTYPFLIMFTIIFLAIAGHYLFIKGQFSHGQMLVGPYDQIRQMQIFKDFLYEEFSQGNFFYSFNYNGGGNFFTRLSYYYTTSIFYYISVLISYILDKLGLVEPDMVYWASIQLLISIVRTSLILWVTSRLLRQFKVNNYISLFVATFFAFSSIYFRHVIYWEFFADAFLWLAILLLGVERLFRGKKGWVFSLGIALTLFNNGYFAFANLLATFAYIFIRSLVKLDEEEIERKLLFKRILLYSALGTLIGLPGFMVFVKGFFDTSRLSPEFDVSLFNFEDFRLSHLLVHDTIQLIPIMFVLVVTNLRLFKFRSFSFFAIISLFLIVLRYSPFVASLFNGLSYPQYRWHYISFLFMAITIGLALQLIKDNQSSIPSILLSTFLTLLLYVYALGDFDGLYLESKDFYLIILIYTGGLILLDLIEGFKEGVFVTGILSLTSLYMVHGFNVKIHKEANLEAMTAENIYLQFEDPDHPFQKALDFIEEDAEGFYRIDFSGETNLATLKQESSFNIYSSFHNHYQQYFHRHFGLINNRENNGIIEGLAGRQILNSLFQVDYIIADEHNDYIVPTAYEKIEDIDGLSIYKNTLPLAFIHPVDKIYQDSEEIKHEVKDEALLRGVFKADEGQPITDFAVDSLEFEMENTSFYDGQSVDYLEESESITFKLSTDQTYDDLIIDYTIRPMDQTETGRFTYFINGESIQLKSPKDPYSSQLYRHQAHTNYADQVTFTLASGTAYEFEVHAIYGHDFDSLEERVEEDQALDYDINFLNNGLDIVYDNQENASFMVLPIIFEEGWQVKVNDQKVRPERVNMGMLGFEIPQGQIEISLRFRQPFFLSLIILAGIGLIGLIFVERKGNEIK